eukprot:gene5347-34081_t
MQKTLACVALFVLALGMAPAQTEARWTGNVMVVNLMQNYSLEFLHCNASGKGGDATSTIKTFPQKEIKAGEVGRFYMDTGGIDWSFQGFCWWSIPGAPKDKECEPHKLPGPVTTCPWIGWDREFIPITGTETITRDFETPGRFGIGDVTVTKKPGHASKIYCVCDPSIENCQKTCAEIN